MRSRDQLELARSELRAEDFDVWVAKHFLGYGRRAGSLALGLSEEQFRYRLSRANLTMKRLLKEAA